MSREKTYMQAWGWWSLMDRKAMDFLKVAMMIKRRTPWCAWKKINAAFSFFRTTYVLKPASRISCTSSLAKRAFLTTGSMETEQENRNDQRMVGMNFTC